MRALTAVAVLVLWTVAGVARADAHSDVTPLVDVAWAKAHIGHSGAVFLDIRNKLDGGSEATYREGHIPGAVYSDYLNAGWRGSVDGVPGQLPSVDSLEILIGGLGIDNDSHVAIIAAGVSALDMGSATRVYWTFKVLGHDKVSILDGGYRAYTADAGNPVETGWNAPTPRKFTAAFRPEMVADYRDVQAAIGTQTALMDMRPPTQYSGEKAHPAAKRPGTIPGAVNVPESQVTVDGGRFVSADGLRDLLKSAGVETGGEAIAFCNTGHWASLGWFAESEILGNKKVKLYDGSMVDWSAREELPIQTN
jgi:thiosulfate/3-mercaptopyruvate sulfurtransferase